MREDNQDGIGLAEPSEQGSSMLRPYKSKSAGHSVAASGASWGW